MIQAIEQVQDDRGFLILTTGGRVRIGDGNQAVTLTVVNDDGHICIQITEPVDALVSITPNRAFNKVKYVIRAPRTTPVHRC